MKSGTLLRQVINVIEKDVDFNDSKDRIALGILSELFPNRKGIGIHSVDLVWGLGAIHCITKEQPVLL